MRNIRQSELNPDMLAQNVCHISLFLLTGIWCDYKRRDLKICFQQAFSDITHLNAHKTNKLVLKETKARETVRHVIWYTNEILVT
jgi:hypothetical protein